MVAGGRRAFPDRSSAQKFIAVCVCSIADTWHLGLSLLCLGSRKLTGSAEPKSRTKSLHTNRRHPFRIRAFGFIGHWIRCQRPVPATVAELKTFGDSVMNEQDAIDLAGRRAAELNLPWSSDCVEAARHRVWPFPPVWRVTATVRSDGAIVTMRVRERTRSVEPLRVRYPAGGVT